MSSARPTYYMHQLAEFLEGISQNNNREWLAAHRRQYDFLRQCWKEDIARLIDEMTSYNSAMAWQTPQSCIYRFARDTRFSPDKSPYKTYFSAALSPWGRKSTHAGCYIEVSAPGSRDIGLWGGLYCPTPQVLTKMRHAIVDNIEEWTEIISSPELQRLYPGWWGRALKTAPKGLRDGFLRNRNMAYPTMKRLPMIWSIDWWPKDHPQIEFLRLQDYGKYHRLDFDFFCRPDWPARAAELMRPLQPMLDFINYTIDEE